MITAEEAAAISDAHRKYKLSVNPPPEFKPVPVEDETSQGQSSGAFQIDDDDGPHRHLSPELKRELEDLQEERTKGHGGGAPIHRMSAAFTVTDPLSDTIREQEHIETWNLMKRNR